MAQSSAPFYGDVNAQYQTLFLEFWLIDQDVNLNRSRFGYKGIISGNGSTGGGSFSLSGAHSISASGQSWSWGSGGLIITQGEFYLAHDSEGKLPAPKLALSASYVTYTGTANAYTEIVIGVPDIPRGSKIVTFADFYINSPIPITLEKAVTTYHHTVHLQVWDDDTQSWVTIVSVPNVDTSISIILTALQQNEIYKRMPAAVYKQARISVWTYSGSAHLGTTTKTAQAVVHPDIVPSIGGMSFYDMTDSSRALGVFVQKISRIKTTLSGLSGARYSTVIGTEIWHNGQSGDLDNPATMQNPLILSGQVGVLGKVIDSRGRVGERKQFITVLPYAYPIIESLEAFRSDSAGKPDPLGTYLTALVKGRFSSLKVGGVEKNNVILRFKVAVKGQTPTTLTTRTISTPSFNERFTMGTYPIANAYDVEIEAQDKFAIRPATSFIPRGTAPFVLGDEGVGVGAVPVDGKALTIGDKGFYHEDIPLTLINGTTGGTGEDQPKAKRIGNMVFISGYVVPNITGARIISTLPLGWRPIATEHFAGINLDNNTPLRFFIGTNGVVQIYGTSGQRFGISCSFLVS